MHLLRRSGGSKDIWATPPGGLPDGSRRSLKGPIALGLAVTMAVAGAVGYSSMRSSTAVSADEALAQFQASQQASDDAGASGASTEPEQRPKKTGKAEPKDAKSQERPRGDGDPVAAATGSNHTKAPGDESGATGAGSQASSSERPAPNARPARPQRPQEGVYAWQVEGYEQAPGVRRNLPRRSHRVINHEGSDSWVEHHIFSEEKEQWMNLGLHADGVTASAVRNRVVMGPVEEDNTVVYNPPVFVARVPNEVGRAWKGSWQGKTSGTYTGRTFDHTTVVIQGERVEVWASEIVMRMHGELSGTATTRSWYSPKYSMVVKQYQIVDVESGPGSYRSEWSGQVLSLAPQT